MIYSFLILNYLGFTLIGVGTSAFGLFLIGRHQLIIPKFKNISH